MWQDWWTAIALLLVLEGIMPFLSPPTLRKALAVMMERDDRTMRIIGLFSMISGVSLLYFFR